MGNRRVVTTSIHSLSPGYLINYIEYGSGIDWVWYTIVGGPSET